MDHSKIQQNSKSYLFSFEGIEGSGKTTQIELLKSYLESKDYKVLCLREPGGTQFGEKLRQSILNSETAIHPLAEAHLFAASRAQLISEKIVPFLKAPKHIVILDRYIDSSIAYQGMARGLGIETILDIHQHSPLDLRPCKTFYLDISLATSLERQSKRGNTKDYFEKEKESFYLSLIDGFTECIKRFPDRIQKINASASQETVHSDILKVVTHDIKL
jgi:dTMP kinase